MCASVTGRQQMQKHNGGRYGLTVPLGQLTARHCSPRSPRNSISCYFGILNQSNFFGRPERIGCIDHVK